MTLSDELAVAAGWKVYEYKPRGLIMLALRMEGTGTSYTVDKEDTDEILVPVEMEVGDG